MMVETDKCLQLLEWWQEARGEKKRRLGMTRNGYIRVGYASSCQWHSGEDSERPCIGRESAQGRRANRQAHLQAVIHSHVAWSPPVLITRLVAPQTLPSSIIINTTTQPSQ